MLAKLKQIYRGNKLGVFVGFMTLLLAVALICFLFYWTNHL